MRDMDMRMTQVPRWSRVREASHGVLTEHEDWLRGR